LAQDAIAESDKPPGKNLLYLLEKQNIVSLDKFPQKEAFLVAKNIFEAEVNQIQVQIVTNIRRCQDLFNKFSPQDTIFSNWDFRYAWYLGYKYLPCFFVVYFNKKAVGLLPLWYENDRNQFRWFGSYWMEDNSFWVFDKKYTPLMLAICPARTYLNAIYLEQPSLNTILNLNQDEPKYQLDLTNLNSIDDFLAGLKKKKRYNLKRDQRIITSQNPKIIFNRLNDLEIFFHLSNKRFGQDSDCQDPRRRKTYKNIIKQAKSYTARTITTEINQQIASVDLAFGYKDTYYAARGANNLDLFPGIGNFINLFQIQEAIKMGYKKIDFLEDDCGWKEELFTTVPLYFFVNQLDRKEYEV